MNQLNNRFSIMFQITDGSSGVGAIGRNRMVQALPLPPSYPAKIHILPIVSPHDPCLQHGKYILTTIKAN